jgi:Uma2 family endonuclease
MPDLQYHRDPRVSASQQQGLSEGRPDLVVEVISPASRRHDRVTKLQWYASIGVPEYWIVDPDARTLERLTLTGEHYLIAEVAAEDTDFCPASFPGLAIPLGDLWALPQ